MTKRTRKTSRTIKTTKTTPANVPVSPSALGSRAMLVELHVGAYWGRKMDKATSREVRDDKNASSDAGAWWTYTIPQKNLSPIACAEARGRDLHKKYTLPWYDNGPRMLPSTMFLKYSAEMRKLGDEFRAAVDDLLQAWPEIVREAQQRLGELEANVRYPSAEALRSKFYWGVQVSPLPDAADFRVDLGEEATKQMVDGIRQQGEENLKIAMQDLFTRLHGQVAKMAAVLANEKGRVYECMLEHMVELCELLPSMNVAHDPNLEAMRAEVLEKLTGHDVEGLRKDKNLRASTAQAANDILAKMAAFMGPKA